jgi:hypothetical protein
VSVGDRCLKSALGPTPTPHNCFRWTAHYLRAQYLEFDRAIPCAELGHQLSCDRRSAKREDEELEYVGVPAVWFELVDDQEQCGADDADRERIEESPHLIRSALAAGISQGILHNRPNP